MFKKILAISGVAYIFLCLFTGVICLAAPNPKASVSAYTIDLGKLEEGGLYKHRFTLSNAGEAGSQLNIKFIRPTCGCTRIVNPTEPFSLFAGEKKEIEFTFNTSGFGGKVEKVIFIETSDPQNPVIRILVSAEVTERRAVIENKFRSFKTAVIVTSGFADGINPCAFTVLVFFVSFLAFAGYSRKQMSYVGASFILAVFLTYLGIGFGLFEFFRKLVIFAFLARWVYLVTALLAMALGLVSLYDYWVYKKTNDPDKIKLKLPGMVKKQIQGLIRQSTDIRQEKDPKKKGIFKYCLAAFSCGFLVSFLELICTGQLYLPTIIYILKSGSFIGRAAAYLILYNVMFVLPLIAVLVLGIFGMNSQAFTKLAQKNLARVKLITAIIFFGLAIILLNLK